MSTKQFKTTFEALYNKRIEYNQLNLDYKNYEDLKKQIYHNIFLELKHNQKSTIKEIEALVYTSEKYVAYLVECNTKEKLAKDAYAEIERLQNELEYIKMCNIQEAIKLKCVNGYGD
jgi:hypothetical protein